jgi:hypothetical protein
MPPSLSRSTPNFSPSCHPFLKRPSRSLILMVIASNQFAAATTESLPYLMATLPPSMRTSSAGTPFAFAPLRSTTAGDASASATPAANEITPGLNALLAGSETVLSGQSIREEVPVLPIELPPPPTAEETPFSPPEEMPAQKPTPVELDALLPFFIPQSAPVTRAS